MLIAKYLINQLLFIIFFLLSLVIFTADAERVSASNSSVRRSARLFGWGWSTLHQGPGNRDQARGAISR